MVLKVTNKKYWGHLWGMLFYLIFCLALPFFFDSEDGTFEFMIKISTVFIFLLCVPPIILFFRYLIVNRPLEVKYSRDKNLSCYVCIVYRMMGNVHVHVYWFRKWYCHDLHDHGCLKLCKHSTSTVVIHKTSE